MLFDQYDFVSVCYDRASSNLTAICLPIAYLVTNMAKLNKRLIDSIAASDKDVVVWDDNLYRLWPIRAKPSGVPRLSSSNTATATAAAGDSRLAK